MLTASHFDCRKVGHYRGHGERGLLECLRLARAEAAHTYIRLVRKMFPMRNHDQLIAGCFELEIDECQLTGDWFDSKRLAP
jgi:hypothetical protein